MNNLLRECYVTIGTNGTNGTHETPISAINAISATSIQRGTHGENVAKDNHPSALSMLARISAYRHIPLIVDYMGKTCFPCRVIDDLDGGPKSYPIDYKRIFLGGFRPLMRQSHD